MVIQLSIQNLVVLKDLHNLHEVANLSVMVMFRLNNMIAQRKIVICVLESTLKHLLFTKFIKFYLVINMQLVKVSSNT